MNCITVTDLKKKYGPVVAVDGISFAVEQGEIFGMLGPNGAGKTTTVETLIGLTSFDSGNISVLGFNPATKPNEVKVRIGVQLQTAAMFPRLTVKETVNLYASFYPKPMNEDESIALVGLTEKSEVQTIKLSGGQLQRLSIALALVSNGDVVFLDEPTTGLDPHARRNLWDVIVQMKKRGKTVFLTTHYMDEAEKLCDRVVVVDRGKIIAMGKPRDLINEYFKEKAIEFNILSFSSGLPQNIIEKLKGLIGVERVQVEAESVILYTLEVTQTIAALLKLAEELKIPVQDLTLRTPTLEDVFLKLTGRRLRE